MRSMLCVRHEPSDSLGVALEALSDAGFRPVVADAWEVTEWPDPRRFAAIAVFGGTMNADDLAPHPFLADERSFLHVAVEQDVPILGVCLGAQILARVLGSPVMRAPRREFGFYPIELTGAGSREPALEPFVGTPEAALTFQWHEDTFALPDRATLLATGPHGLVQAYRAGSVLAVQFHPEVTADEVEGWVEEAGEERVQKAWGKSRRELRRELSAHMDAYNDRGRAFFRNFALTLEPLGAVAKGPTAD